MEENERGMLRITQQHVKSGLYRIDILLLVCPVTLCTCLLRVPAAYSHQTELKLS